MNLTVSKQQALRWLLLPFCSLLAMGKIAYSDSSISALYVTAALFILFFFILHIKFIVDILKGKSAIILILVLTLSFSELISTTYANNSEIINIKLIISIFFFLSLSSYLKKYPEDLNFIFKSYILGLAILIIMIFFIPGIGIIHKGKILIIDENPNSTGARLAIGGLMLSNFILNQRTKNIILLTIKITILLSILYLIIMGGSRGALILFFICFGLMIFLSNLNKQLKITFLSSLTVLIFSAIGYLTSIEGDIGEKWSSALSGDTAGRTDIWATNIMIFMDNPLFGVGESGFLNAMLYNFGSYKDSHNVFIYLLTSGGIIAFILYTTFLLLLLKNAYLIKNEDNGLRIVLLISAIFLASKTGGALTYLILWFLYAIIDGGSTKKYDLEFKHHFLKTTSNKSNS